MSRVFVSLGSNVDKEANIQNAVASMRLTFGELLLSPVYLSAAVGFEGDDFLNLVAAFETDLTLQQIIDEMSRIEDQQGRDRTQPRFSARAIDLDLLLFDTQVLDHSDIHLPREEILLSAHVLRPLQDLIADQIHPVVGQSYGELWSAMADSAPRLDVVELELD